LIIYFQYHFLIWPTFPHWQTISIIYHISLYWWVFLDLLFCSVHLWFISESISHILISTTIYYLDIWIQMWKLACKITLKTECIYGNFVEFTNYWRECTCLNILNISIHESCLISFCVFSCHLMMFYKFLCNFYKIFLLGISYFLLPLCIRMFFLSFFLILIRMFLKLYNLVYFLIASKIPFIRIECSLSVAVCYNFLLLMSLSGSSRDKRSRQIRNVSWK
jgi:hypothetical protein